MRTSTLSSAKLLEAIIGNSKQVGDTGNPTTETAVICPVFLERDTRGEQVEDTGSPTAKYPEHVGSKGVAAFSSGPTEPSTINISRGEQVGATGSPTAKSLDAGCKSERVEMENSKTPCLGPLEANGEQVGDTESPTKTFVGTTEIICTTNHLEKPLAAPDTRDPVKMPVLALLLLL